MSENLIDFEDGTVRTLHLENVGHPQFAVPRDMAQWTGFASHCRFLSQDGPCPPYPYSSSIYAARLP